MKKVFLIIPIIYVNGSKHTYSKLIVNYNNDDNIAKYIETQEETQSDKMIKQKQAEDKAELEKIIKNNQIEVKEWYVNNIKPCKLASPSPNILRKPQTWCEKIRNFCCCITPIVDMEQSYE